MIRLVAYSFAPFLLCLQGQAEVFSYPFNPDIGHKWSVHEVRIKTTNEPNKPPKSSGEVFGTLEVTGHTELGYIYSWTTDRVEAEGMILSVENSDPSFMIGTPITYESAADGTPIRVRNVEKLLSNAESALISYGSITSQQARDAISLFSDIDSETLSAMLLKQANLVGSCQGYQLDSESPIEQDTFSPSLGGAPPIKTIVRVSLIDPGSSSRPAIIESYEAFDPRSAAESIFVLFTEISQQQGRPAPTRDEIPAIERTTTVTCEVDVASGETLSVVSEMRSKAQGIEQTDTRKISVKRLGR